MKQTLNLKLNQQLTLTPQLKQSLRLLQLPSLELEQEIQQTLDANPLLERAEDDNGSPTTANEGQTEDSVPQPIAEAVDPSIEIERTDHLAAEQDLSSTLQESFESHRTNTTTNNSSQYSEFTQFVAEQETLIEHLSWQIQMTSLSEKDKLIAGTLLHCLDGEGYLSTDLDEICKMFDPEMAVEKDELEAVLSLIKTLDPVGVGARDLRERLVLLLQRLPNSSSDIALALEIVSNYLDLLGTRNLAKLKKELGVGDQTLSASIELITQLNPRIAADYMSDNENYIIPDIIVKKIGSQWHADLNPENQAKLRVNKTYSDMLKRDIDEQGGDFIRQNLIEAKMFIKGLMSRYDTLLLVGQAIVERLQAFFEHGAEQMLPMVLQDIAAELDMHESTISRATAGKYLLSPSGVFELKYFFSSALQSVDGAASSSTAIRSLIKKMVDAEPKKKPLSDSKIVSRLEQQGHIVARRTVAKYRESMQIAPSSQRKSLV